MENLEKILATHSFFADLSPEHLQTVAGCAKNVRFDPGEFIFKEGEAADQFYLIRYGQVSVDSHIPSRGDATIDMVHAGEILGWSWLFPPYRWHFDAKAVTLTRAIAMDGKCMRRKKDEDHELGYHLMSFFASIMQDMLQATRMRLVDMYSQPTNV